MFLAIIIPPGRNNRVIAGLVTAGFTTSFLASRLPLFQNISTGAKTIALTIALALITAILFPVSTEESNKQEKQEESRNGA